ncbi:hypothetical protein LTR62_002167 [Meristemomyces frigidus]|uniref:PWI domain-containing protein n=1 Tax=Meristemomyces frigidus TaxID=1508187 RepID=A0AAN7YM24_9PEZI|nr:hypothetical protein LTR62_002167 [Meristemomyces frigidus]
MAYYGAPPGAYSQQPQYGAPPSFAPPGIPVNPAAQMPAQFQPPPHMPNMPNMPNNFDWTASTIRLGVDGPSHTDRGARGGIGGGGRDARGSNAEPMGGRNRLGLGASRDDRNGGGRDLERERQAVRDSMLALTPPTREEVARTIFIGGLGEGAPKDEQIEAVLRCAGKLRRWTRARDADDQQCKFGFAEFEDVDSLEAANAIFGGGVELPVFKNGVVVKNEEGENKMMKLLIVVDEQSRSYITEWKSKRKEDDDARQFRLDGCKEDLRHCITSMTNAGAFAANASNGRDANGDIEMTNGDAFANQDNIVTIQVNGGENDELSDVPAELRATVAAEIKAFRDKSIRRDFERVRREEEAELAERRRNQPGNDSFAPTSPSGLNGAPSGPRGAQVHGAPAGPRGLRGAQLPEDYRNGVAFVPGSGHGTINSAYDEEDAEESDEELEARRQRMKAEDMQRKFLAAERKWLVRERTRKAALAREREREERTEREMLREKDIMMKRLAEWDDEAEESRGREEWYLDKSLWQRKRAAFRSQEERGDAMDRQAEDDERRREADAGRAADEFLDRTGKDLGAMRNGSKNAPAQGFKISLGSAAARKNTTTTTTGSNKRGLDTVEGLLEDEEDAALNASTKRPTLKPLAASDLAAAASQNMTDEERASARQTLASEIPTTTAELFATPLKHKFLTSAIRDEEIRPYVERLVLQTLGVQEDFLVDVVMDGLKDGRPAGSMVEELEGPLEEEAEALVRKVWRLGVFWGEAGARGLV